MYKCKAGVWARRVALFGLVAATLIAAGCGGGGSDGASATPASANASAVQPTSSSAAPTIPVTPVAATPVAPTPVPADPVSSTPVSTTPDVVVDANAAPTIAAAPALTVMAGSAYTLIPAAQDADGDTLAFSVTNRPKWATFSTVTGQLTGKPSAADVGTYNNVSISVSDGTTATSLPAFTVTVAAAAAPASTADGVTLEWTAPLAAVDNSQLTNLAGYRIHYGTSETALTNTIEVANPGVLSYVMQNLEPGTYYFAVRAFNDQGEVSDLSNVSSLSIT